MKWEPGGWWYNWATLFLGDIRKYGKLAFQVGVVSNLRK
jgi:hypothetical protein